MSDRNNRGDREESHANEVGALLKRRATDSRVVNTLQAKYNDASKVQKIFDLYKESKERTERRANKFLAALQDRYQSLTPIQIYDKALKYKSKVDMTDAEFEVFRHLVFSQNKHASNFTYNVPNTRIAKLFGYSIEFSTLDNQLNVEAAEEGVIQEILRMHAESKMLHQQVSQQAYTYTDDSASQTALTRAALYKSEFMSKYNFVHPIIVSLFMPKINILEEHMLYASISDIVRIKHEGKTIVTRPNYMLLWDMMTDPNDAVCNIDSAIVDIKNRASLQVELWKNVLNLRQGKVYTTEATGFSTAIQSCRINMFDSPDLTSINDEGVVFRRLMSAFSLRPTIVRTTPFDTSSAMATSYMPIAHNPTQTMITSVPMLSLRLPSGTAASSSHSTALDLTTALSQTQWFVENKRFVSKSQAVIQTNNMIVFYVPRRYQSVDHIRRLYPHKISSLPTNIVGSTNINSHPVNTKPTITVGSKPFKMVSAISVDLVKVGATAGAPTVSSLAGCKAHLLSTNTAGLQVHHTYEPLNADNTSPSAFRIAPDMVALQLQGTIFVYSNNDERVD